jgi:hypothetical protein
MGPALASLRSRLRRRKTADAAVPVRTGAPVPVED